MHYLFAFIGAVLGTLFGITGGFLVGGLLGLGGGLLWRQAAAIRALEARLDGLEAGAPSERPEVATASEVSPEVSPDEAADRTPAAEAAAPMAAVQSTPTPTPTPTVQNQGWEPPEPATPREPSAFEARLAALWSGVIRFATTGNPVVRIGAVVLFIGVAYLMRYAYEHSLVPVELRLAGAGLGGIVLLMVGWRLRDRADTYGLILQGVGLAILYLTVFASARLYELLPMGAAFAILVALVAGASVLAVLQKSQALAIFSMSGGFLAPVLTSTGEGSHVALFSYYALLNAGILGMAWFSHWRWLNWTGFVFTFVIGASWGYEYYEPKYFASTEPFLILFFLYYLSVSILFARRQTVELKGVIDGTLVFGTPVIAFALQAALVRDMPFGLAFSALAAGAIYTGLALWLKRQGKISGLLDQSFVALAVVFATLAIPFAFDNQRFTAATWALEGAGIFWVGVRQAQRLPRAFGVLLQLAAGCVFVAEYGRQVEATLFLNSAFLGTAFLGLAGLFTAFVVSRNGEGLHRIERLLGSLFLGWGTLWWLAGGLREFSLISFDEAMFTVSNSGEHLFLTYWSASVALLIFLSGRLRWPEALYPGFTLLPVALAILVALDIDWQRGTALADFGWLAWPAMLGVFVWHLRQIDELRLARLWHAGGWWFVTLLLTWNAAAVVDGLLDGTVWTYVLWGAVPLAVSVLLLELRGRLGWPFGKFAESYFGWGWLVSYGYLLMWLLMTGFIPGDPDPIPFVTVLNPLELVQAAVLLVGVYWARTLPGTSLQGLQSTAFGTIAAIGFAWINFVAIRTVHYYADVAYPVERIVESDAFQSTVTILWTSIALVLMGLGTRRAVRLHWLVGATLLGVVILKLFLVDMGNLDLVARIISFITVGILMLVIGYFAPIPPKRMEPAS